MFKWETLKRLKWLLLFAVIALVGGLLTSYADWTAGGIFIGGWNLISGIVLLIGFAGFVWQAIRLNRKG